jgi:UDP-N-acetylmuramate dehydrogenase
LIEELKNITNEANIYINEPMSKHTSFKTGGPADVLVIPENREEIVKLFKLDVPKTIIGNGTNLLVKDGGIRGLVIKISKNNNYSISENVVTAESGISVVKLSKICADNGLSGLEFACGIPGTLGGAVMMNAGAYGGEFKDVVFETEFLDNNGNVSTITNHEFGFRSSVFMKMNGIILSSKLKLNYEDKEIINNKMKELTEARKAKQPLNMPSAGSTFKRPEGYFVGKLIEEVGLKGYSIGGAQVSTLHAGFIVNSGNATSTDILNLIHHIQNIVNDKYGVNLETEIRIIGEDK